MPADEQEGDPVATAERLETLDPRIADALRLILRIAGGDFAARGTVSDRIDGLDAIVVGLNMLAESFAQERDARSRAELLLADALDAYENAPGLYCSVDAATWTIVKHNRTLTQAVGVDDLRGRSVFELFTDTSRDELARALQCIASGAPTDRVELELIGAEGALLTMRIEGSAKRGHDGEAPRLRLLFRDVTAERALEAQLLHAQKMEAIGRLAGGIAHDFNNLLMVIEVATGLLAKQLAPGTSQSELLAEVHGAGRRAAELTRQLLTFARREPTRPSSVDLGALLAASEPMLRRLLGTPITLELLRADGAGPFTRIDPARLEQAIMNLVINARDAMPDGGRLVIAVEHAAPERGEPRARISVTDSGPGIAPDVLPRIFEPFFTTKPKERGTGLGLAMVYGIITQAGGEVRAFSELGRGARIELLLPAVAPEGNARMQRVAPANAAGGIEHVLVVEDDANVRRLMQHALQQAGYRVSACASADEAIALDRAILDSIEMVVSDVLMPGMPGPQLLDALRQRYPRLPCMLVSGYSADQRIGAYRLMTKPFTAEALAAAVREELDREPGDAGRCADAGR